MKSLKDYDELEKAVRESRGISDFISSSVDDSVEEKLFYSVLLEVVFPSYRWLFYVATHEEDAFKRCFDRNIRTNHRRFSPAELFYCLSSLSDENRRFVLGKLNDVSDGTINKLSKYLWEDCPIEFSNVINETNINTSSIAAICSNVKDLIDCFNATEQLFYDIDKTIQIEDDDKVVRQMEKSFNVFLSNIQNFIDDEEATDSFVNYINSTFGDLLMNEKENVVDRNMTKTNYHFCIWIYHFIRSEDFASSVAQDCLYEIVFNPKYKDFWKGYEDKACLKELEDELENYSNTFVDEDDVIKNTKTSPQTCEFASQKSIFTWRLPENFFDNNYIVDCDINEYFPGFLKNELELCRINDSKMAEVKISLNNAFERFVNELARTGYIKNNHVEKSSFAHALTGRKVDVETKRVTWKRVSDDNSRPKDWLNDMCYLVRELYPTYLYDKSGKRMRNKFMHILKVFEIDPSGDYKLSSSYAKNADGDFIKKVEDFLEVVRMVKDSVFPEKGGSRTI